MREPTRGQAHLPLRVSTRRVLSGAGEQHSVNEVFCLRRDCTIDVAECDGCVDHVGDLVDLARHRNYVLCREPTLEAARALGATRRTVLRRRGPDAPSLAVRTPLAEMMTCDVFCAAEDLELVALAALLRARDLDGVPVVDDAGCPVGMVTQSDVLSPLAGASRVGDIVSRLVFTLPETASVAEAAALMAIEGVHHLPVVAADGVLVGLVSSLDLLAWMARSDGYVLPR